MVPDRGHAVGDGDTGQPATAQKRIIEYARNRFTVMFDWNIDLGNCSCAIPLDAPRVIVR